MHFEPFSNFVLGLFKMSFLCFVQNLSQSAVIATAVHTKNKKNTVQE